MTPFRFADRILPAMSSLVSAAVHVHPATSSVDWAARWIAFVSLLISFASVIVTVHLWRRSGWRLWVQAFDAGRRDGKQEIEAKITNTGRLSVVVTDVGIWVDYYYSLSRRSERYSPADLVGEPLPRTLAPSESLEARYKADATKRPWSPPGSGHAHTELKAVNCKVRVVAGGREYYSRRTRLNLRPPGWRVRLAEIQMFGWDKTPYEPFKDE
jgi:hypothetical protein